MMSKMKETLKTKIYMESKLIVSIVYKTFQGADKAIAQEVIHHEAECQYLTGVIFYYRRMYVQSLYHLALAKKQHGFVRFSFPDSILLLLLFEINKTFRIMLLEE